MEAFPSAHPRPGRAEVDPDLHEVAHNVHAEFDQQLGPKAVDECLREVASRFDGATVRSFVPLLVRRYVREELKAELKTRAHLAVSSPLVDDVGAPAPAISSG